MTRAIELPRKFAVRVGAEDIQAGDPWSYWSCPIARATLRTLAPFLRRVPKAAVAADDRYITLYTSRRRNARALGAWLHNGKTFMQRFDAERPVKPTVVRLRRYEGRVEY